MTVAAGPPVARADEHETLGDRGRVLAHLGLRWCSRTLPERTGRYLFTRLGRLACRLSPRVRRVVAENQAQVLGRPADDPLVQASTREAFALYGRYWFDAFHLARLSDDEIVARVRCDTVDRLREAHDAGKGAILALPHLGNWDAAGRWMSAIGLPVVSVAEDLRPRRVFDLFLEHRSGLGMDIVDLSDANVGRQLSAALSANRMVALVADRHLGGRGVEVEMFGRSRRLPAGPALLALTTGAPLMVTPTFTTPDGWRIRIGKPLSTRPTGDRGADVRALTQEMARGFEEAISAAPADWHMFQPAWEP